MVKGRITTDEQILAVWAGHKAEVKTKRIAAVVGISTNCVNEIQKALTRRVTNSASKTLYNRTTKLMRWVNDPGRPHWAVPDWEKLSRKFDDRNSNGRQTAVQQATPVLTGETKTLTRPLPDENRDQPSPMNPDLLIEMLEDTPVGKLIETVQGMRMTRHRLQEQINNIDSAIESVQSRLSAVLGVDNEASTSTARPADSGSADSMGSESADGRPVLD